MQFGEEAGTIDANEYITLRQASKILDADQRFVKGVAFALKIRLKRAAGAFLMDRDDFARLKECLEAEEVPAAR